MTHLDDDVWNMVVKSTAQGIASGADHEQIAARLVERFGEEQAFLLFRAAETYLKIPDAVLPSWRTEKT
jgi:3-methyladenine DNA glycosylase/8-oxoguanine DNA glycosylase